jgi:hypothetical protein
VHNSYTFVANQTTKAMKIKLLKLSIILFICATSIVSAQSFKSGTVAGDFGVGLRLYGVRAYSPVNKSDVIGIFIGSSLPVVNAEFGFAKFLGAGLRYSRGSYLQQGFKVRTNDISVALNFHVANKNDKFDLPISVGYGLSTFKADQTNTGNANGKFIHATGGVVSLHLAPHFYFSKYIGMFIRVGYNKTLYKHVVFDDAVRSYDESDGATWKFGGFEFAVGVAGRFHLFNKD